MLSTLISFFSYIFLIFVLRCIYLIFTLKNRSYSKLCTNKVKTMIIIGSGGHTSEMLRIVKYLNHDRFTPRVYVVANSDKNSLSKINETEKHIGNEYIVCKIPRSRKVHQSYITSIFTTLYSTLYSLPIVFLNKPDLIICNGPGTCVPICIVSFLMRVLYLSNNVIIFIESACRVKTLSLTGKILMYFADLIIVQWRELHDLYKRTVYIGDIKL